MRLARVLGAIGRALISAGVIVLLFVGYQLWGTGIQNAQAQDNLVNEFEASLQAVAAEPEPEPEPDDVDAETASVDDAEADDEAEVVESEPEPEPIEITPQYLKLLYPDAGDSLARIVIPKIDVDQIVVEGVSVEDLRKGPGHYPSTPNPGQAGNASIAGHRTTYGQPFHRVDELNPGDKIFVTTVQGEFTYEVMEKEAPDGSKKGYFIVAPGDTWVLGQDSGQNMLTLTACHPKYSAAQRIIVQALMVGEPAETIPRGEADDFEAVQVSGTELATEDGGNADGGDNGDGSGDGDGDEIASDLDVVISDEVAADDDPSVDADGNPIDSDPVSGSGSGSDSGSESDSDAGSADGDDGAGAATGETETDPGEEAPVVELDAEDTETASSQVALDGEADFGEGLDGDPTRVRPAILWGLAGGSIWLAAWFIGKRLNRKWTMYFIGLVPFVPVLWSCFVNIDQALPSY